jgi:hypothetical protein
MPRVQLDGWRSSQRQTAEGAVESEQRVALEAPVVDFTEAGARKLGASYWAEVERSLLGLVRRDPEGGLVVRVLGRRPVLLRFGEPQYEVGSTSVVCRYPITGGLLAQRPVGEIDFAQHVGEELELLSSIRDFFPALAVRDGEPNWSGALYTVVQSRIHIWISRRYFARLIREARG